MNLPKVRLRIFDKSSQELKYTCYCSRYKIVNDYLSIGTSEFYPDISIDEWKNMFINAETYTDDIVAVSTVTENIPNEVALLYLGILESFDKKLFIKTKHFLKIFDSQGVPADQYIKGSVPSGQLADGTKLGSIQMQLAHIFLAHIIHGFGYNCWEGMADLVKNFGSDIDSKYQIGYNQNASSVITNQQLCLFEWEQDKDPLGPDLSKIGNVKYSSGLWTPLSGAIIASKKSDIAGKRKEFTIKVRNLPKGGTDKTDATVSKWWDNKYTVTKSSVIEFIKKACVEYGVVITPTLYYSNSIFAGITKQNGATIRDDIYKVERVKQDYGNTELEKKDYEFTLNVGPFTDPDRTINGSHLMNSVASIVPSRAPYVKLTITDKSSVVKSIDMNFKTVKPNICYVYLDEANDKDSYYRERVFGPDIIVFKLSSGKYYKVMSGDYADMIRYGGGTYYKTVYNVWPSDWRSFDQRIPANVDHPYNFITMTASSSFKTEQYKHYNNPFSGPSSTTVVWGNNWLDYFGCPEIFEEYGKVVDDLYDAPARLQRFKDAAESWHGVISVDGTIDEAGTWAESYGSIIISSVDENANITYNGTSLRQDHDELFRQIYINDLEHYGPDGTGRRVKYGTIVHSLDLIMEFGDYSSLPSWFVYDYGSLWMVMMYCLDTSLKWRSGEHIYFGQPYMVASDPDDMYYGKPREWFEYWQSFFEDWRIIYTYPNSVSTGNVDLWFNKVIDTLNRAETIVNKDGYLDGIIGYLYYKVYNDVAYYPGEYTYSDLEYNMSNHFQHLRNHVDTHINPTFRDKAIASATAHRNKVLKLIQDLKVQMNVLKEAASPSLENVSYYTSRFGLAIPDNHPSVSDGNQIYSEKRYTDVEAKSEELGNRLRQLDYEFSEAVKEMSKSDKDDVEVTVEVYNNANWNPLDLRVGMYADISYKGKTYSNIILTGIEVDSTANTHKLTFGAKRSTFYATFERK